MKPKQIMLIAGEASGDLLAAELVHALRRELAAADAVYTPDLQPLLTGLEPRFFGAGGPRLRAAGVELDFDLLQHSVVGFSDVLKNYVHFRRLFARLLKLAVERQPDVIIGVDYGGFNLRFARAIRARVRSRQDWFHGWRPKIVQYVSPQVWASRAERAYRMARDHDLVLSLFPFEKQWYAARVPKLRVEFVGHPLVDWVSKADPGTQSAGDLEAPRAVLLLPGSRRSELKRHLPVMLAALKLIRADLPQVRARMILPDESLLQLVDTLRSGEDFEVQIGELPQALASADLAIASTGTVTMECALFGLPAVTLYKTSWANYQIAMALVKVRWATMPNLLANQEVYPEFIQHRATPENIARAALDLLRNESRRATIRTALAGVVQSLGGPGASRRAAQAIAQLLQGGTGNS